MNYVELSAAISATMENTFPATDTAAGGVFTSKDQIDLFIRQAEQRICNTVQFPALRKNVTGVAPVGSPYLPLPGDFLAPYSMALVLPTGAYTYLLNKDVNFLREAYANPATLGVPRFYALFGPTTTLDDPPQLTEELSALLAPTPDRTYTVQLHYFFYPESIVTAGNSWLGDNVDAALLAAAVLEAAIFMKADKDQLETYAMRYQEALGMAKRLGDGMERQDSYRSGQYRQKVT
jgi:hypothetical protein